MKRAGRDRERLGGGEGGGKEELNFARQIKCAVLRQRLSHRHPSRAASSRLAPVNPKGMFKEKPLTRPRVSECLLADNIFASRVHQRCSRLIGKDEREGRGIEDRGHVVPRALLL